MNPLLPDSYVLNEDKVWVGAIGKTFTYSDGADIENRLLAELKNARDVSCASDELQALISDWPSEYHYSPLRPNLLAGFDFSRFTSVLEVGSGCGALTRFLGEQRIPVLALEGSLQRSRITRERCRELDNVAVCCESFGRFAPATRFAALTLIGVLEYSPAYIEGPDPVVSMLRKSCDLLEDGGVLFLAIENQLGLKYFNGCSEDHSGIPFTGINDRYLPGTYRTLGKKELIEKIVQSGFVLEELFLPFPDYKLPRVLVREAALADDAIMVSSLIEDLPSRDYTGNKERIFDETGAWRVLERNGLMGDLANSFLVVARKGKRQHQACLEEPDWLVQTFSCPRKKGYLTRNHFRKEQGRIVVDKRKCYPTPSSAEQPGHSVNIEHVVGREPFRTGARYADELRNQLGPESGPADYLAYLKPWIDFLLERSKTAGTPDSGQSPLIDGGLLDCHPGNLLRDRDSGEFQIIDQEWNYHSSLETGFLIFRGIFRDLTNNLPILQETGVCDGYSFLDLITMAFSAHGLVLDTATLERYAELEVELQLALIVYRANHQELKNYLLHLLGQKQRRKPSMASFLHSGGRDKITGLEEQLGSLENELRNNRATQRQLREEMATLRSTWSWKIGRFLTGLLRLKVRKS